jgi:Phosphotransferase enzyme family
MNLYPLKVGLHAIGGTSDSASRGEDDAGGIVRRGGQLLRPIGPWSGAVHEYLRHLESRGFAGAPRVLGTDGGREILTFIDGEVATDPQWRPGHGHRLPPYARREAALIAAAALVRQLHEAARGYRPTQTEYRFHPHPPRAGEIVSHGDLGPCNTVYRDGVPVAFIDWDSAGPIDPALDLAAAAWAFVPLARPTSCARPDSTLYLACRPGSGCSWTHTA